MQKFLAHLLLSTALFAPANAQIVVDIADYSRSVYSYQPVYVVYAVQNLGIEPEVVPTRSCPGTGTWLEARRKGGNAWHRMYIESSHCRNELVSLGPGERYLIFDKVVPSVWVDGTYEMSATVSSGGVCRGLLGRAEELRTVALPPIVPRSQLFPGQGSYRLQRYTCWKGKVSSEIVEVDVRVPVNPVDKAVRELLGSELGEGLSRDWRVVVERFPSSEYAYVAALQGGGTITRTERAMALQPEHPLNQYVLTEWASLVLECTASCRQERCDRELLVPIDELPVGDAAQAWLQQRKREIATECERQKAWHQELEAWKARQGDTSQE